MGVVSKPYDLKCFGMAYVNFISFQAPKGQNGPWATEALTLINKPSRQVNRIGIDKCLLCTGKADLCTTKFRFHFILTNPSLDAVSRAGQTTGCLANKIDNIAISTRKMTRQPSMGSILDRYIITSLSMD